jgi:hypothetical protein
MLTSNITHRILSFMQSIRLSAPLKLEFLNLCRSLTAKDSIMSLVHNKVTTILALYFKFSNFCPMAFLFYVSVYPKKCFFLSERAFSGKLLKHLNTKCFITQDPGHITLYMTSHVTRHTYTYIC